MTIEYFIVENHQRIDTDGDYRHGMIYDVSGMSLKTDGSMLTKSATNKSMVVVIRPTNTGVGQLGIQLLIWSEALTANYFWPRCGERDEEGDLQKQSLAWLAGQDRSYLLNALTGGEVNEDDMEATIGAMKAYIAEQVLSEDHSVDEISSTLRTLRGAIEAKMELDDLLNVMSDTSLFHGNADGHVVSAPRKALTQFHQQLWLPFIEHFTKGEGA